MGLERDGVIELGRVVMLPGEPQVVDRPGTLGTVNSQSVLTVAQNERRVTLDIPADRRDITAVGSAVQVSLPDGNEVTGTVSAFGDAKEKDDNGTKKLFVPTTVAGSLDTASGDVVLGLLRELHASGTTVVVITHDQDIAAGLPRRIELHDGRIVADRDDARRPQELAP